MLPMNLSTSQVKRLLSFEDQLPVTQMGLSMTLKQLQALYQKMPTQASLELCTRELNSFINKYAAVMEDDLQRLSCL